MNKTMKPPTDYKEPNWNNPTMVHDWKTHVPVNIRNNWELFSFRHRAMLSEWAQDLADIEDWD